MPGGRPKGSKNQPRRHLMLALQAKYPDWEPVSEMVEAALKIKQHALDDSTLENWKEYVSAVDKVAAYITPKLRSVETTVEQVEKLRIAWDDGSDGTESRDPVPGKATAG